LRHVPRQVRLAPSRPAGGRHGGQRQTINLGELEARSNRLAHFCCAARLGRLDHYSIYMENNARYVECCAAGERSGTTTPASTPILTAEELAYILNNSQSKVLITSQAKRDVALAALPMLPRRSSSA
jgi:long-chain acyl-CoA synthetase